MKFFIKVNRFNEWLSDKLSAVASSIWTFYVILILVVTSAILSPPTTFYLFVMLVVSIGYQGLALAPMAMVSDKAGKQSQRVLNATHREVMQELKLARQENAELKELLKDVREELKNEKPNK